MHDATRRGFIGGLAGLAALFSLPALAHHGWSWTSESWFELEGTITEIYIGQPHATLKVDDGEAIWDVDLAPLQATLAAGFDEDAAAVGDAVTLIGHRASDAADTHMKAVRVVVGDAVYDVYPDRAAELG